jgi:hypothetical protein
VAAGVRAPRPTKSSDHLKKGAKLGQVYAALPGQVEGGLPSSRWECRRPAKVDHYKLIAESHLIQYSSPR